MHSHWWLFYLEGLSLAVFANAQNTTTSLSGTPNVNVGWEDSPKGRGTLSLIYSCLVTIFASTWTVLHLNVPGLDDGPWTKALRKAKWMAITVLFPEFVLSKAICDLRLALHELSEFDKELECIREKLTWTVGGYRDLSNRTDFLYQFSWTVEYGWWAGPLYRILGLPRPRALKYKTEKDAASTPMNAAIPTDDASVQQPRERRASLESGPQAIEQQAHDKSARNPATISEVSITRSQERTVKSPKQEAKGPLEEASMPEQEAQSIVDAEPPVNSSERAQGQREKEQKVACHAIQNWTVTHSSYANMGGLCYPNYRLNFMEGNKPRYYAVTGSIISAWDSSHYDHPLKGLILHKQDIEDKSKADWLLKSIAMLQITWVVLSVAVRRLAGLPVTQLEIATIAFSVFAIATYLANWWKPKDVSRPTVLQYPTVWGSLVSDVIEVPDRTQEFMLRIRSPAAAAQNAKNIYARSRIGNDQIWIEGDVPIILTLMATSSLVFGGLHCLAWNFAFPTRAELIAWRTASLASAIIPVILLAISLLLNYIATIYTDSKILSSILNNLKPLEQFPEDWWYAESNPPFREWREESLAALLSMPKNSRTWEQVPPSQIYENLENEARTKYYKQSEYLMEFFEYLNQFYKSWSEARKREVVRPKDMLDELERTVTYTCLFYPYVEDFWLDYEDQLRNKLKTPTVIIPDISAFKQINETRILALELRKKKERTSTQASTMLTICSGILYITARLLIIVLLFTSLRSVPAGVYENTPWTRLLPNIS